MLRLLPIKIIIKTRTNFEGSHILHLFDSLNLNILSLLMYNSTNYFLLIFFLYTTRIPISQVQNFKFLIPKK